MSKNILLISTTLLKSRMPIHDNVDDKLLESHIKAMQDIHIKPVLGSALFTRIQTEINTTVSADIKALMDDYIVDALCNYTMAAAAYGASYQLWNKGLMRKTSDNAETVPFSELDTVAQMYERRGEYYADALKKKLLADSGVKYPEYLNPGSDAETVTPKRNQYETPFYLGDDLPMDEHLQSGPSWKY